MGSDAGLENKGEDVGTKFEGWIGYEEVMILVDESTTGSSLIVGFNGSLKEELTISITLNQHTVRHVNGKEREREKKKVLDIL